MNALSGLDPKYIDEAAFELHGKAAMQPAQTVRFDAARKARLRRNLLIALPAAAAAFLLIAVAVVFPTLSRLNKSDSASMAESAAPAYEDSAAEAPSYAEEAPSYEEAAAEPEPAYEAEQPQMNEAVTEAEGAAKAADAVESAAEAAAPSDAAAEEAAEVTGLLGMTEALYNHGILYVETANTLPDDVETLKYTITGTDDGVSKTYAKGTLGDILTEKDLLILDITELKLQDGTYTLSIEDESIEFVIE